MKMNEVSLISENIRQRHSHCKRHLDSPVVWTGAPSWPAPPPGPSRSSPPRRTWAWAATCCLAALTWNHIVYYIKYIKYILLYILHYRTDWGRLRCTIHLDSAIFSNMITCLTCLKLYVAAEHCRALHGVMARQVIPLWTAADWWAQYVSYD